jgi:hypothetical protein
MCIAECYMKGEKSQKAKIEKSVSLAKCPKNDASNYLPYNTSRIVAEIQKSMTTCVYLTADNTEILSHVPPSRRPQRNSVCASHSVHYPLLYTLSSVTVFSDWWRFSVFINVHRFTGHSFTIQSYILFHLSWFLNRFSTHGFQNRKLNTLSPVMVCRIHNCILPYQ